MLSWCWLGARRADSSQPCRSMRGKGSSSSRSSSKEGPLRGCGSRRGATRAATCWPAAPTSGGGRGSRAGRASSQAAPACQRRLWQWQGRQQEPSLMRLTCRCGEPLAAGGKHRGGGGITKGAAGTSAAVAACRCLLRASTSALAAAVTGVCFVLQCPAHQRPAGLRPWRLLPALCAPCGGAAAPPVPHMQAGHQRRRGRGRCVRPHWAHHPRRHSLTLRGVPWVTANVSCLSCGGLVLVAAHGLDHPSVWLAARRLLCSSLAPCLLFLVPPQWRPLQWSGVRAVADLSVHRR